MIALEEYAGRCAWCGFALKDQEVAGEVLGRYIDYTKHNHGEIGVVFCGECWQHIMEIQDEPEGASVDRRNRAFGGDQ